MHVNMEYGLSCSFVHIYAYVVAIGVILLVKYLLDALKHHVHILTLLGRQVKITGNMTFGYDKGVPWRNGVLVVERNTGLRFANNIYISAQRTERTLEVGNYLFQRIISIH